MQHGSICAGQAAIELIGGANTLPRWLALAVAPAAGTRRQEGGRALTLLSTLEQLAGQVLLEAPDRHAAAAEASSVTFARHPSSDSTPVGVTTQRVVGTLFMQ